jgi:repressor LexA
MLTRKQREVLTAIEAFAQENGYMPSIRELAERLGLGVTTTHFHLSSLQAKGVLERDGSAHGIQLRQEAAAPTPPPPPETPAGDTSLRLPIVGTIAAGRPIEAIEFYYDYLSVPASWIKGESYILRVQGQSMKDDAILDGDHVVIQKCDTVADGTIAVALLEDGSATLKRIYREKDGKIRLQPANEELQPVYVDHVRVQGKVVGVIRKFN